MLSLRESCLPEMGTGSLGGGRRPARERASSDPRNFWLARHPWKVAGHGVTVLLHQTMEQFLEAQCKVEPS